MIFQHLEIQVAKSQNTNSNPSSSLPCSTYPVSDPTKKPNILPNLSYHNLHSTVESGGSQNVQEAGTIRVEFKAARIVGSEDAEYIVDGTEQTAVNEKAKKGALISHVTL